MKWRRKQQQQQQQQEQRRSSSAFSFSQALLHGGWLSKLKQSFVGKTNATKLNQKPASKNSDNPARVTTVSDHLSINSSRLGHFIASEDLLPPRHSYCDGEDEVPCFNCKSHMRRRRRSARSFGDGCEEGSGYEPDNFPFSSCRRGCRSDLLRSRSEKFEMNVSDNGRTKISGNLDLSENFLPGVKPIQTSVIDKKYPDQDPMDLCRGRKSVSHKIRHRNKVKINSPRLTVRKKVVKLEEPRASTREARLRKLESFAVTKCSLDPQKDFRDSMVEMISENRIARPEELESLLACYLSLNSDEYHGVIVKVFRQVWFDLNPDRLVPKSENRENTMRHRSKTIRQ